MSKFRLKWNTALANRVSTTCFNNDLSNLFALMQQTILCKAITCGANEAIRMPPSTESFSCLQINCFMTSFTVFLTESIAEHIVWENVAKFRSKKTIWQTLQSAEFFRARFHLFFHGSLR